MKTCKLLPAAAFVLLLLCAGALSQTKTIAEAEAEIRSFPNPESYAVGYDQTRYVTEATVSFDILEPKTPLAGMFREFGVSLSALFAVEGIEERAARATFCVNTRSKVFHFSSDRRLTLVLDGEEITLGEADRATEVKGGKVRETLCREIDLELIRDLGRAASLELRAGKVSAPLNAAHLRFLANYAGLVRVPQRTGSKTDDGKRMKRE